MKYYSNPRANRLAKEISALTKVAGSAAALAIFIPVCANAQEGWAIEEIVVTAQRRTENINDVGITVNAFSGEQMKELGIKTATDMAQHTPGMTLTEAAPNGIPVYTLRGMGFDDYSAGSNSTVGVYVNQVALPYPVMTSGQMFDIERIEVLKGAQGDLYGRNSTGGAINFISNKPAEYFGAGFSLDYGRYDYAKVDGYITGALNDAVQGRFAFTTTRQDEGIQKHLVTGERLGKQDKSAARALLNWNVSENLSVLADFHIAQDDSDHWAQQAYKVVDVSGGTLTPVNPAELNPSSPRDAAWDLKPQKDQDSSGGSITVDWALNDVLSLTSISAYDQFERDDTSDWDGTSLEDFNIRNVTEIDSYSQELRLSANGDRYSWIAGLYLSSDTVDEAYHAWLSDSGASLGVFGEVESRYQQETDTRALFGHAELELNEQWHLSVGTRYTHEKRSWQGCTYDVDGGVAVLYEFQGIRKFGNAPFELGDCSTIDSANGNFNLQTGYLEVDNTPFKNEMVTENVSAKITLDYAASEDILIYATLGTGFKSGGYNGALANDIAQLAPYQEEETTALELGVKATLLNNTMQLNGALFHYDYRDKQVVGSVDTFLGPLTTTVNVPRSEIEGAELELQWRPLAGLDLKLGVAYLDTLVKEYDSLSSVFTSITNAKGAELPNTAQWQYNGLIGYEFAITDGMLIRMVTNFSYSDSYYNHLEGSLGKVDEWHVEDYWLVNARLALAAEDGSWEVALWSRNLEDKHYYVSSSFGTDTINRPAGPGNTYGINFSYHWM
ncbi:TonB-dependent receptor [Pseudomaricurvus alkylphenolicus]|uniref:TonB-dependent receptor n=1 Tax=Pseudomaricurvus alkylphenolicus TaxID=1306991 RepID=UPI0014244F17|nr:TonB-dependent receptor [Pseudomaricurvus alkylphenolicus]NIB42212.1 TonB-dependent receptor [Pseudomaricurvus alkylphenolicus]